MGGGHQADPLATKATHTSEQVAADLHCQEGALSTSLEGLYKGGGLWKTLTFQETYFPNLPLTEGRREGLPGAQHGLHGAGLLHRETATGAR